MAKKKVGNKKEKKEKFLVNLKGLFAKYKQIAVCTLTNVGSLQIQQIRKDITLHHGLLVIGKNTVIKKAIKEDLEEKKNSGLDLLYPLLKQKIGFIFTNEPLFELKQRVESNKIPAGAKVGMIAPINVTIPPGPTGLDPSQIGFFHALQISTKIQKGQIEITKDYQVCTTGKKIGSSEFTLLQKMNLKPFEYHMKIISAFDEGTLLGQEVINMSPDDLIKKFQSGVSNVAALSVQTGIPTELTLPSFIQGAFKNLAAIGMEINYKFKQIANAQQQQQQKKEPEKKEKEKPKEDPKPKNNEKPPEEEPEVGVGDLFG